MSRVYTLTCTEPCAECSGAGSYDNPEWQRLFAEQNEIEKANGRRMTNEEFDALVKTWERERTFGSLGPETCWCVECEGTGKITTKVSLVEALQDLGLLVKP